MIRRWVILGLAALSVIAYAVFADVGSGLYNRQHIAAYVFYRTDSTLVDTSQAGAGIAKLWAIPTYYVDTTGHGIAGTYTGADSHGYWYWINPATDLYDIYSDSSGVATLRANDLLIYGRALGDSMIADSSNFKALVIPGSALLANTITANKIAANAVTASELADNAVDSAAVASSAIHPGHILMTPTAGYASMTDYNGAVAVALDSCFLRYNPSGIAFSDITTPASSNVFLGFDNTIGIKNVAWRAMSGDMSNTAGLMEFVADSLEEDDLKAVDAAADEDVLTFEATTGDFEWHTVQESARNQSTYSPAASIWGTCPLFAQIADPSIMLLYQQEFIGASAANILWTSTASDLGAAAAGIFDNPGGIYYVDPSDATVADNDESYLHQTATIWQVLATKSIWCEFRIMHSEANTDDANVIVGLFDAVAANLIQDNGAGPAASYDGICIFKVDGGAVWQAEVSNGGSQSTDTNIGARTKDAWTRLAFIVTSNTSVEFFVNGVSGGTLNTNLPNGIMKLGIGIKNGDTNEEYLYIDAVQCAQLK